MAIYTVEVKGIGTYDRKSLNRTYTIEAANEKEATLEAQRRRGVDPQLKFVPASQFRTDIVNMTDEFAQERAQAKEPYRGEGLSVDEIKRLSESTLDDINEREQQALKDVAKQEKEATARLDTFQRTEGEEAATTTFTPTFDEFTEQYVEPQRFHAGKSGLTFAETGGAVPAVPYHLEPPLPGTPDPAAVTAKRKDVEGQIRDIEAQGEVGRQLGPIPEQYQTELTRRQALEQQSPFAVFLDELQRAGLGGLQGAAGRFAKSQYQPLYAGYQAEQLMPLMGDEIPFGEDLSMHTAAQQMEYRQALMRQQTGDYEEGEAGARLRIEDEGSIARFSPTFGEYARGGLAAGGRQAQQRMGQQLQALAQKEMGGLAPGSFTSRFLAPESEEQAAQVMEMAGQAQAGRYSPIALQALQRYMPNASELWANYLRQSTPLAGADVTAAQGRGMAPPNFAQFVGQQYGLY